MVCRHYSVVIFAVVALFSCAFTEARSWGASGNPLTNTNDGNSLLSSPDLQNSILDTIFQSRGTSLDQLRESLSATNGDVGSAVSGINSGLNSDILKLDGNLLKLNSDNLKALLRESLQGIVNKGLPNNPGLASIIGNGLTEQLDSQSQEITDTIESVSLPVDAAQALLENDIQSREKRSLQPRDGLDLGSIVSDIVVGVVQNQLSSIISNLLETAKNWLLQFYTSTPPANEIESVIVFAKNTIIQKAVEVLTVIQQGLQAPAANTTETATARRKRQAETGTDAETVADADTVAEAETGNQTETGSESGSDGTLGTSTGGLLDIITRPLLNILAKVLSPVNSLVKNLVAVVSNLLRPILGDVILVPLGNVLNALIDLLLPSNQV